MSYSGKIKNIINKINLNNKVVIGDPCYDLNGVNIINNVLPGTYHTIMRVVDCDSWGNHVSRLIGIHEKYIHRLEWEDDDPNTLENSYTGLNEIYSKDIGVDSGQAGIYDYDYFCENLNDREFNNTNGWYRKICDITIKNDGGSLDNLCTVSRSGYGDGCYKTKIYSLKNEPKIVAFLIDFDVEYPEDEYFDEEDDFEDD